MRATTSIPNPGLSTAEGKAKGKAKKADLRSG